MKIRLHPSPLPTAGGPRRRWPGRIAPKLHWIAIALWAAAFIAALLPLLGL